MCETYTFMATAMHRHWPTCIECQRPVIAARARIHERLTEAGAEGIMQHHLRAALRAESFSHKTLNYALRGAIGDGTVTRTRTGEHTRLVLAAFDPHRPAPSNESRPMPDST